MVTREKILSDIYEIVSKSPENKVEYELCMSNLTYRTKNKYCYGDTVELYIMHDNGKHEVKTLWTFDNRANVWKSLDELNDDELSDLVEVLRYYLDVDYWIDGTYLAKKPVLSPCKRTYKIEIDMTGEEYDLLVDCMEYAVVANGYENMKERLKTKLFHAKPYTD